MASSVIRLRVSCDATITDCFARLPAAVLQGQVLPMLFASAANDPFCAAEVISQGNSKFVAIALQPHAGAPVGTIVLATRFALKLGLSEEATITLKPLPGTRTATKVVCEPATIDDSEILEHNQALIENTLLRRLRVVSPGLHVPVFINDSLTITLIITSIEPSVLTTKCAILGEGTELHIATKTRQATSVGNPQPGLLRGVLANVGVEMLAGDLTGDLAINTIFCTRAVAESLFWSNGLTIGVSDMSDVGRLTREAAGDKAEAKPPSHSTKTISFDSPSVLRVSWRMTVRVVDVQVMRAFVEKFFSATEDFPVRAADDAAVVMVSIGHAAPISTFHCFPNPPPQVPTRAASQLQRKVVDEPGLTELAAVHGDVVRNVWTALAMRPVSGCSSSLLPAPSFVVCGDRGSGKSAIVRAAAAGCGRHVITIRLAPRLTDMLTELSSAVLEASLCSPSLIVLEDLEVIAPAAKDGQANLSTADIGRLERVVDLIASFRYTADVDVGFVATARSRDALHKVFTDTSKTFSNYFKIAPLALPARVTLLSHLIGERAPDERRRWLRSDDCNITAATMENYAPFDFVQVVRRAAEYRESNQHVSPLDALQHVLTTYEPLSHSGAGLHKKSATAKMDWGDVGGLEAARKALLDAIVLPAKFPQIFERLPLKTRSGVLLYGPPGCGKTHVLTALVAAEGLNCIVVNGPEILDKYIGASEQKVRDVFERAQAASPCVVFFDEFDSIAPQRGHDNTGVTDRVVNQLLCYLDGVEGRKNVFVVAASSRPDLIDAALLRPGRLDKAVLCGVPNRAERLSILQAHCRKITIASDLNLEAIADVTECWTGADLAGLVATANLSAVQRHLSSAASTATCAVEVDRSKELSTVLQTSQSEPLDPAISNVILSNLRGAAQQASRGSITLAPRQPEGATNDDFRSALAGTRRSITEADLSRYTRLYDAFAGSRRPVEAPGSRTTHV